MLIAAAVIELELAEVESIKSKRRVVRAVKDRLRQRYNVSVAEVAAQDERHSICIGCVKVGIDAQKLRTQLEGAVRYVESLGLAEVVGDDVTIVRLDELVEVETGGDGSADGDADEDWEEQLVRDWESE